MEKEFDLCDFVISLKNVLYSDFNRNMSIIVKLNNKGLLQESATEEDMMMLDTLIYYEGNGSLVQLFNKLAELMGNAGFGIEHLYNAFPFVYNNEVVEYIFINKELRVETIHAYDDSYKRLCELAYDSIARMVKI